MSVDVLFNFSTLIVIVTLTNDQMADNVKRVNKVQKKYRMAHFKQDSKDISMYFDHYR